MQPLEHDIIRRGNTWYEQQIRSQVEPQHDGDFIVINIDTGEFEMDADDLTASKRARERFPDGRLYAMRIGQPAAYKIGGRFRAVAE
jgi:hypothetical protein